MFTDSPPRPGSDPNRNAGTVNRVPVTPQAWQEFFLSLNPSPVPPSVTAAKPGRPEKPQGRSGAPPRPSPQGPAPRGQALTSRGTSVGYPGIALQLGNQGPISSLNKAEGAPA